MLTGRATGMISDGADIFVCFDLANDYSFLDCR